MATLELLQDEIVNDIIAQLKQHTSPKAPEISGWENTSGGSSAIVYLKDNYAAKIDLYNSPAYKFLSWCQTISNPSLPVVYHIKKFTFQRERYFIALLERLRPLPFGIWCQLKVGLSVKALNFYSASVKKKGFKLEAKHFDLAEYTAPQLQQLAIEFSKNFPGLDITIDEIAKKLGTKYFDFDQGNVMLRGETIVLVDPV